jgi:hypothetical protein
MIVESPLVQELLHEWTEAARREAAEQALQQGLQQGRVEGEIEAAIHIARRIAESRFGLLPPELEQRLRAMPMASERPPSHAWRPWPRWRSGFNRCPEHLLCRFIF